MNRNDDSGGAKRREFLKLLGLGTLAGAAGAAGMPAAGEAAPAGREGEGYRETAHVKKFYDLARF